MRTLQEKYNGIQEGKFSKENFLADARRELPNLVTRFNGYDDAVQILKNRGMISEIRKVEVLSEALNKDIKAFGQDLDNKFKAAGFDTLIIMQSASPEQLNIVKTNTKAAIFEVSQNQEAQMLIVRVNPEMISKAESIINKFQLSNYNGPVLGKGWTAKQVKGVINPGDIVKQDANRNHGVWEFYRLAKVDTKVANVNEARLTKNNLTDYRYKPTNEMDKYPYEQILRGIRVELEGMGVQATPTAEEYAKALAKVSKNLGKDSIFYTNQLAGVNPKVDQHDQMVDATAKNTVDTFNGMKKAELKEGFKKLIKKVLSEEVIDVEDYNGEDEFDMYGDDEADDIPHPRGYEDQDEIDYDDENFSDPFIDDPDFQFEATDTEADKDMVRKLMTMYETEPSKFERLHKQAQTQASTSKDVKYKHLLSLIDRAKAGALQSLSNQDRAQADSEGMDENLYEARKAKPLSELLK